MGLHFFDHRGSHRSRGLRTRRLVRRVSCCSVGWARSCADVSGVFGSPGVGVAGSEIACLLDPLSSGVWSSGVDSDVDCSGGFSGRRRTLLWFLRTKTPPSVTSSKELGATSCSTRASDARSGTQTWSPGCRDTISGSMPFIVVSFLAILGLLVTCPQLSIIWHCRLELLSRDRY